MNSSLWLYTYKVPQQGKCNVGVRLHNTTDNEVVA